MHLTAVLIWVKRQIAAVAHNGRHTSARPPMTVNAATPDVLPLEVDLDLIRRMDRNGPRYTSYPTADRFVEAFDAETYKSWVARRNIGGIRRALSIYVHLPFCGTVCFYCACNKVVTRDRSKGEKYLE